jgi:hypothetical protein
MEVKLEDRPCPDGNSALSRELLIAIRYSAGEWMEVPKQLKDGLKSGQRLSDLLLALHDFTVWLEGSVRARDPNRNNGQCADSTTAAIDRLLAGGRL